MLRFLIHQPLLCLVLLRFKFGKLHILGTVNVKLKMTISNLGRDLFLDNFYVRSTFFTKSGALLKMVKKFTFLRENVVFNIVA